MKVVRISDCSQCKESSGIEINDLRIGQDFERHINEVREEGYAPSTTSVLLDGTHSHMITCEFIPVGYPPVRDVPDTPTPHPDCRSGHQDNSHHRRIQTLTTTVQATPNTRLLGYLIKIIKNAQPDLAARLPSSNHSLHKFLDREADFELLSSPLEPLSRTIVGLHRCSFMFI